MKYIDLHCDTILPLLQNNGSLKDNKEVGVDLTGLKKSQGIGQCFAIWMPDKEELNGLNILTGLKLNEENADFNYIEKAYEKLNYEISNNENIVKWAEDGMDIENNEKNGLISAILTLEDGRAINNDLTNVDLLHSMGVRMIGLTWNYENCIGYPNSDNTEIMNSGLKKFGLELVEYMNYLGIIIDVSHLSDGGFWDIVKNSKKPFIASHSNCRNLVNHSRNLSDKMIKALGNAGGIMGINFTPSFLTNRQDPVSTVELMVYHLNHMKNIGGADILALGSDLDGTWGKLEIGRSENMQLLFDALLKNGWTYGEVEKMAYKNSLRIFNSL